MKRHTMKSFWLLQNLGGIRRLLRRGIAKKYIAEKYGINVLTLKRFVAREAPDIPWGAGGKAKRQRVERNATIVRRVVDLGETYKRVGEDYGLTREAVRLIVVKGHPGWKRPLKYTPCKRCGKKRTLSEVRARTRRSVDEANELCGACRVELRRRVVVLTCIGCVRQTKRELSEILRRKNANT